MSKSKIRRESLEDEFAAPSGPGRRGEGLARLLPPSRGSTAPRVTAEKPAPVVEAPAGKPNVAEAPRAAVPSPVSAEPGRAAELVQVSAPTSTSTADTIAAAVEPVVEPQMQPSAAAPAPASSPVVPPPTPKPLVEATEVVSDLAGDDDDIENMPVYLDAPTLKALKAEKGRIGGTYADVAEEALEAHIDEVGAILRSQPSEATGAVPRRRKKQQVRGGIQVQLRFSKAQRNWLDTKKDEFAAPSRSTVVALALQLKLGTRPA